MVPVTFRIHCEQRLDFRDMRWRTKSSHCRQLFKSVQKPGQINLKKKTGFNLFSTGLEHLWVLCQRMNADHYCAIMHRVVYWWDCIPVYVKSVVNLNIVNPSVCPTVWGGFNRGGGGGLFKRGSLFHLAKTTVSVLHKELEYKVEKLKYKKLEII